MNFDVFVHDDDSYVSINDGVHGDTLLKMPDGEVDIMRVKTFVNWVNELHKLLNDALRDYDTGQLIGGLRADTMERMRMMVAGVPCGDKLTHRDEHGEMVLVCDRTMSHQGPHSSGEWAWPH